MRPRLVMHMVVITTCDARCADGCDARHADGCDTRRADGCDAPHAEASNKRPPALLLGHRMSRRLSALPNGAAKQLRLVGKHVLWLVSGDHFALWGSEGSVWEWWVHSL